jgi:hypothetical protein
LFGDAVENRAQKHVIADFSETGGLFDSVAGAPDGHSFEPFRDAFMGGTEMDAFQPVLFCKPEMSVDYQPPAVSGRYAFYQIPHLCFAASRLAKVQVLRAGFRKPCDTVGFAAEKLGKGYYGQSEVH